MMSLATEAGEKKRILCVDDDADTRELMGLILEEQGYEVILPLSASDVLEYAKPGEFDLYILDHWLSDMDGIELCRQIRACDPETPIMFYSGAAYQTDIEMGLDAGAQAYVVKPRFDHLTQTVDRLVNESTFYFG